MTPLCCVGVKENQLMKHNIMRREKYQSTRVLLIETIISSQLSGISTQTFLSIRLILRNALLYKIYYALIKWLFFLYSFYIILE